MDHFVEQNSGRRASASERAMGFSAKRKSGGKRVVVALGSIIAFVAGAIYLFDLSSQNVQSNGGEVIAKVGGHKIYEYEVDSRFTLTSDKHGRIKYRDLDQQQKQALIKEVAVRKLIVGQAKQEGLHNDVNTKVKIDDVLKDAKIAQITREAITGQNLQAHYNALVKNLDGQLEYNISHIVVETEKKAKKIAGLLNKKKPESFAKLAKEHSIDKLTAKEGGKVGFLALATTTNELKVRLKDMQVGDITDPFKTEKGWHIAKLVETRPAQALAFDAVKERIAKELSKKAVQQYVDALMNDVEIELVDPKG